MRKDRVFKDDGKIVFQKTTDPTPVLERAAKLRAAEDNKFAADNWHVGSIDKHVFEKWLKEAGLRMDDREAVRDMLKKKLLDGDNAAFRVRQGTY